MVFKVLLQKALLVSVSAAPKKQEMALRRESHLVSNKINMCISGAGRFYWSIKEKNQFRKKGMEAHKAIMIFAPAMFVPIP